MDMNEYQALTQETAIYPGKKTVTGLSYATLGLNGEAGEVAEKVKKLIRDKQGVMDAEFKAAILKELGDVMWYVSAVCSEVGVTMEDAVSKNIEKLLGRKERGTLQGSGDNR